MSDLSLDQLLSDEEVEQTETETEEEGSVETPEAPESGEASEADESTGVKQDDPPPGPKTEQLTEEESWTKTAVLDERRKRQELERELEKYRTQSEPPKTPDVLADPEGFAKHQEQRLAEIELKSRISMSQAFMRRQHADYDEKEAQFLELTQSDPSLVAQLRNHEFPAEFIYKTVEKHERFSKFDNFDQAVEAELAKRMADAEKTITAKLTKEFEAKLKKANSIPPSGADGSLARDNTAVGDESLDDILGNK